jgi:hypothetical protein
MGQDEKFFSGQPLFLGTENKKTEPPIEESTPLISEQKVNKVKKCCRTCKYCLGLHTWYDPSTWSGFIIWILLFILFLYVLGLIFNLIMSNDFWLRMDLHSENMYPIFKTLAQGFIIVGLFCTGLLVTILLGIFVGIPIVYIINRLCICWKEGERLAESEENV